MKKIISTFLGILIVGTAFAGSSAKIEEGVDYTVIPGVTKANKKVVNVKEFFSFNCIHCKELEPLMEKFVKNNSNKMELEKVYATWKDDSLTKGFAKLNATLQARQLNRLYIPAFNAIFEQQNLSDPVILRKFLKDKLTKAELDKFFIEYDSFNTDIMVGKYKNMTLNPLYNIEGTPTIIVADKYIVKPAQPERLIEVTNGLVNLSLQGKKDGHRKIKA